MSAHPNPQWADYLTLPVLYFLGAKLGVHYTVMPEGIAILWPPNAALLAALLIFNGQGYFRWITLALIAEVLADWGSFTLVESLLFGITNIFEATLAFTLLSRLQFNRDWLSLADLPKFVVAAPVIAAGVAALMGAIVYKEFRGTNTAYLEFFRVWWFGDAMGLMIFTPLILGFWRANDLAPPIRQKRMAFDLVVAGFAVLVFGLLIGAQQGIVMGMHVSNVFLLPFIVYIAVRCNLKCTAVAVASLALFTVFLTTTGKASTTPITPGQLVVTSQAFIFTTSVMALGVASLMLQIRKHQFELEQSNKALQELNHTLELRIQERTESLEAANQELETLALTDPLTGLLNRRGFMDLAMHEFKRSLRHHQPISLISIDIDHFKAINDTYGHQAGDEVLHQVSEVIKGVARKCDLVSRFGGEEFILLTPNTDLRQASAFAERLRKAIRDAEFDFEGLAIRATASFGIAERRDEENFDKLSQRADACLYQAKRKGRNRVEEDMGVTCQKTIEAVPTHTPPDPGQVSRH